MVVWRVYVVLILFITLPVSIASVKRTFNKLKIIKDCKINSIGQTKLRDFTLLLLLLCIEHKEAAKMDIKDLINNSSNAMTMLIL